MAGNIVKWWKHKILGGYKQFTVQECTTDSEELMYHQVRASSSCSAPPDLLLVSDRDSHSMPLHSPMVNIIATTTTTTSAAANTGTSAATKVAQQQQPSSSNITAATAKHAPNGTKEITSKNLKFSSKTNGKLVNTQLLPQQHPPIAQQHHNNQHQQYHQQQHADEFAVTIPGVTDNGQQQQQHQHQKHNSNNCAIKEERIRLEEFTCDVSVEGGKSTQPLQFSFTFYDLDGHHGKITKDDIVGIVYTIYESIGKSVVVPHCGSKTINVRLTVSPEAKSKSSVHHTAGGGGGGSGGGSKFKKLNSSIASGMLSHSHHHTATNSALKARHSLNTTSGLSTKALGNSVAPLTAAGRRHRYRPRKLVKSDDEDDDSNSERERELAAVLANRTMTTATAAGGMSALTKFSKSHLNKYNKMKLERELQRQQQQQCCSAKQPENYSGDHGTADITNSCQHYVPQKNDNLYENMSPSNSKNCHHQIQTTNQQPQQQQQQQHLSKDPSIAISMLDECQLNDCGGAASTPTLTPTNVSGINNDVYMKQASARVKMLRKARKQKYQDHCYETRQRSLSVGNETNWKISNPHITATSATANNSPIINHNSSSSNNNNHNNSSSCQQTNAVANDCIGSDMVDGVQLRNPHKALGPLIPIKRNSTECWKTALNRNDLISIIRESMEKNRLCFQLNGKPQANVSPIRQPPLPLPSQSPVPPSTTTITATTTTTAAQHLMVAQQAITVQQQQHHHQHHRQRSNTVSKIPTLIANHSNSPTTTSMILLNCSDNNQNQNNYNNNINNANNNNRQLSRFQGAAATTTTTTTATTNCNQTNNNNNNNANYNSRQQQQQQQQKQQSQDEQQQQQQQQQQTDNKSHSSSNNSSSHYHPQPHIPIYHQQMAINPIILAAAKQSSLTGHSKMNLCGYDSYLHATFCDGGATGSPHVVVSPTTTTTTLLALHKSNNTSNNNNFNMQEQQQPIAAVQPLLTSTPLHSPSAATTPTDNNKTVKTLTATNLVPTTTTTTTTNIKQSCILRNNSYAQQQHRYHHHHHHNTHAQQENSPQYHGYQRLSASATTALQQQEQQHISEHIDKGLHGSNEFALLKRSSMPTNMSTTATAADTIKHHSATNTPIRQKNVKNYDNLLYARLQEKLQISTGNGKENVSLQQQQQQQKQSQQQQRRCRYNNLSNKQQQRQRARHRSITMATNSMIGDSSGRIKNDYISLLPLNGDPAECEHLLSQTTDDEVLLTPKTLLSSTTTTTPNNVVQQATKILLQTAEKLNLTSTETTTSKTESLNLNENEKSLIDLHNEIVANDNVRSQQTHQELYIEEDVESVDVNAENAVIHAIADHDDDNENLLAMQNMPVSEMPELSPNKNNLNNRKLIKADLNSSSGKNNTSISSSASSLIHRYVHEHIHHHYHHFEDKEE